MSTPLKATSPARSVRPGQSRTGARARRGGPVSFLKLSSDVASFWGFRPIKATNFSTAATTLAGHFAAQSGEPALAYWVGSSPSHLPSPLLVAREHAEFGLGVVGSAESVGEVVLLKTLTNIIEEWGGKVARVRVNALGDKDSKLRFARELAAYLRKHATELDAACRHMLSDDPLKALVCQTAVSREVVEGGPRPMNFLSEKSRAHFRDVLEHVERVGLPYELDDTLVGDEREPRVTFAIDLEGEDATITAVAGGRFDDYLRRVTNRKEGSAVSASIYFRRLGLDRQSLTLPAIKFQPKIFFVQLGLNAKLEGLRVLGELRRAQVPVAQSFNAAQLGPQLLAAKAAGVSHLIIMGAREAIDGTVLVRSMRNSSQEVVPLHDLPRHLKSLR